MNPEESDRLPTDVREDIYTVETITELGAMLKENVLGQVMIDDHKLDEEARMLPNLIFFWQAAYARLDVRAEQKKLALKRSEAEQYIALREQSRASAESYTVDEIKARITVQPHIQQIQKEITELIGKRDMAKAMLASLRQKGYSLQLIANIRGKEEDWLRQSFARRLEGHPNREQLLLELARLTQSSK